MFSINSKLIDKLNATFQERFGRKPTGVVRAPGRVNLLGEHVDYNQGFVMPAAIDRATYMAFAPASGLTSTLVAGDFEEEIELGGDCANWKQQAGSRPLPDWGLYPAAVAHVLRDREFKVAPVNAVFASDVPRGAGLSSSASVEVAFLTMWQSLGKYPLSNLEKARICQKAENQYVGVNCGIMDQFASVCGVENRVLLLDCRSLTWDTLELPENISIVVADTMIRRKLNSSEYNQRRQDCEEAVEILKMYLPEIRSLRDVTPETYNRVCENLPPRVEKRARHVVEEIDRTGKAKGYLETGNLPLFGNLMNECHVSLRDLYEVSSLELNALVNAAQSIDGCYGARLTGAGFGGCTVNLVETAAVNDFVPRLKQIYHETVGIDADVYVTNASAGSCMLG